MNAAATRRQYEFLPRRVLTPALNVSDTLAFALDGLPASLNTNNNYGGHDSADGALVCTPAGHLAHVATTGEVTDLTVAVLDTYSHVTVEYAAGDLRAALIASLSGE